MSFGTHSREVPGLMKRDLMYILFRRKRLMLTFLVSTVLAAFLYVLSATPTYESTAKILIRIGRESSTLDPTTAAGKTISVAVSMQQVVKSEMEILNSQELAEKVVDAIGVSNIENPPPDPPQPGASSRVTFLGDRLKDLRKAAQVHVKRFKEKIGLLFGDLTPRQRSTKKLLRTLDYEGVYESNIIIITSQAETRTMAQRILQELLKFYLEKHLEVYKTLGSADFFLAQAKTLKASIAMLDAQLQKVKNDSKIISLDIQQAAVAQRIAGLQNSIQNAKTALAAAEARIETITSMRKENAPDARWQMQKLVNDQDVLAQKNEIAVLRAQVSSYETQLRTAEDTRRHMTESEGRIKALENELETDRASYKTYMESVEQARIENVFKEERISNVRLVEEPSLPIEKESPKALIDLALGIVVGLFGGIGLAFLVEYYDSSVKRPEDVEDRVGIATLTTIPEVRRAGIQNPLTTSTADLPAPFLRAMRALIERLTLPAGGAESRLKVIGVTSAYAHEGVTTICSHLASLHARNGRCRVLLVDANLEAPAIHRIPDTPSKPGFREAGTQREGSSAAIHGTALPGLQVVRIGGPDGVELNYEDDGGKALVDAWRRGFDLVVVDLPSLGIPNTIRLASLLDGVLVVVEADRVRWQALRRLKERLDEANAKIVGVVLNRMRYPIPSWIYRRV